MKFNCKDPVNEALTAVKFSIEAVANEAVKAVGEIEDYTVKYDKEFIELPKNVKDYFSDKEGAELQFSLEVTKNTVPVQNLFYLENSINSIFRYLITFPNADRTDAGTYALKIVATDNAPQETYQEFSVTLTGN